MKKVIVLYCFLFFFLNSFVFSQNNEKRYKVFLTADFSFSDNLIKELLNYGDVTIYTRHWGKKITEEGTKRVFVSKRNTGFKIKFREYRQYTKFLKSKLFILLKERGLKNFKIQKN